MIQKANQLARGSSLGDIDLMLIDAIKANAHGRKVKDIHFDPYSENGVVKVGISFEEEKNDNVQDYSGLSDLERAIHRGFLCAGVENVPRGIIEDTAKEALVYARGLIKDELAKKHLEGYIMGREDTMREMRDFIESHLNCEKAREGTYCKDMP